MQRRSIVLGALWLLTYAAPLRAQSVEARRRVGILIARRPSDPEGQRYLAALLEGLRTLGWTPDSNLQITVRWQADNAGQLRASVDDLVAVQPDLLIVLSTPYLRALQAAAPRTPIVFVAIADPVGQGFVPNLARPGGQITGFGIEESEIGAKWLELLREIVPDLRKVAGLFNPETAPNPRIFLTQMEATGRPFSIETRGLAVRSDDEIRGAIAAAAAEAGAGLIVLPDAFLHSRRALVTEAARKHKIPTVYYDSAFVAAGGLVAYGIDRADLFRRAATYVDQILNGAHPGDLPVQMPVRFELAVNMNSAKALGMTIPTALLTRADEVIE